MDMKNFKLLPVFLALFTLIGFTSCDVEPVDSELIGNNPQNPNNPNNPNNPGGPATFTVDFNGQTFTATGTQAFVTDGLMSIQGLRGSEGESVTLVLPANGVGTYSTEDVFMHYATSEADEYGYTNLSISTGESSGTITITALDEVNNTISGTFSFTGWYGDEAAGVEPIVFTNGSFSNIAYTGEEPGDDVFTAMVNGVNFNTQNIVPVWADAGSGATISINAYDDDLNSIVLYIQDDLPEGTYPFLNTPLFDVDAKYVVGDVDFDATEGSLTITSKTATTISGTFNFTGTSGTGETVTVTNGTFDVTYL